MKGEVVKQWKREIEGREVRLFFLDVTAEAILLLEVGHAQAGRGHWA